MTSQAMKATFAVLAGAALLLGACSSGASRNASDEQQGDSGGAAPQPPAAGGGAKAGKGALLVTLAGGPYPGKYEVRNVELPCIAVASNASFTAVWGANVEDPSRFDGLTGLFFETTSYKGVPETKQFRFSVQVIKPGQVLGGFLIEPGRAQGSGTASVDDRGASASVRVSGQTKDGVKIDARMDCSEIGRI